MSGFDYFSKAFLPLRKQSPFMLGAKLIIMMERSDTKHPLGILFKNVPTDLLDSSRENHVSQTNVKEKIHSGIKFISKAKSVFSFTLYCKHPYLLRK